MSAITSPSFLVFGIPENANRIPVEMPEDVLKVRVRFRADDFARIWLKTSCGVRQFVLGWNEDRTQLKPSIEEGSNYRK